MNEEIRLMVSDCLKRKNRLNEWESEFIDKLNRLQSFTDSQLIKLEEIWEKATS